MDAQERQEIRERYAEILGDEVFRRSWALLYKEGYSESSLPYLSPEIVHQVCGDELMRTWKEKFWPKYPYLKQNPK